MQESVNPTLSSFCYILRESLTPDGAGGFVSGIDEIGPYPCRVGVYTPRGTDTQEGGAATLSTEWIMTLPPDVEINPTDILRIGDVLYNVVNSGGPHSIEVARRVVCSKKQ